MSARERRVATRKRCRSSGSAPLRTPGSVRSIVAQLPLEQLAEGVDCRHFRHATGDPRGCAADGRGASAGARRQLSRGALRVGAPARRRR